MCIFTEDPVKKNGAKVSEVDYFGEYEAICEMVLACESGP
jgi:hypothetical protein